MLTSNHCALYTTQIFVSLCMYSVYVHGIRDTTMTFSLSFEQKEAQPREVQLLHYEDWKGDIAGSVQDLVQLVDIVLSTTPPPGQGSPPVVVQCRWVGKPMLALQSLFKVSSEQPLELQCSVSYRCSELSPFDVCSARMFSYVLIFCSAI